MFRRTIRAGVLVSSLQLVLCVACGGEDGNADSGSRDSGSRDSGSMDSGSMDSGSRDSGSGDSGPGGDGVVADVRPSDGGIRDGGADSRWLHTTGNAILHADGTPFRGRGANLHDTRGCNACAYSAPDPGEVRRRIDELVDVWGANFMRLTLESYETADGRTHFRGVRDDSAYLADILSIIQHIGTKPGVYVLVSLWIDPSFDGRGRPTAATRDVWRTLAAELAVYPHVLFGLVNEPESNFRGAEDAAVWEAMNDTVIAIREVEAGLGSPEHLIAVQGTRAWGRILDYYVANPIEGTNIVYETHVYDPASVFESQFIVPSMTLPVIIGEFGPVSGVATMSLDDCDALITAAEARNISYLAWTFHMRCPPNLLVDNSGGGCGSGMTLAPTEWGTRLMTRFASPWGR